MTLPALLLFILPTKGSVALLVNSKVMDKTNSSVDPLHMPTDIVHSCTDDSDSRKMSQSLLKKVDGRKVDKYGTVFGVNISYTEDCSFVT